MFNVHCSVISPINGLKYMRDCITKCTDDFFATPEEVVKENLSDAVREIPGLRDNAGWVLLVLPQLLLELAHLLSQTRIPASHDKRKVDGYEAELESWLKLGNST